MIELIAPCGMYCGYCNNYLAFKNSIQKKRYKVSHCSGCRIRDKQCSFFKKRCKYIRDKEVRYCFQCVEYPCEILIRFDKSYQKRYNVSFINNFKIIQELGEEEFIEYINRDYTCNKCGEVKSVHSGNCYVCDLDIVK